MRLGAKLGPRGAILVAILLSASVVGILTPTLSNTVDRTVQVNGQAITLTVDGIPATVAPGDLFRVMAAMANNANRPVPAVLRMEVRNPNSTAPDEVTVYADWGAEEVVSSRTLSYYIGWHGPLLAPMGVSYAAGTPVAALQADLGAADYWPAVVHEIEARDPAGYASLIAPGTNATEYVRMSGSLLLKALYYYGMLVIASGTGEWALAMPFSDHIVASGGFGQQGFLVEIHIASRGSFEFRLWAEQPDGLGIPHHPSFHPGPL